jgi:hypothetical protein
VDEHRKQATGQAAVEGARQIQVAAAGARQEVDAVPAILQQTVDCVIVAIENLNHGDRISQIGAPR